MQRLLNAAENLVLTGDLEFDTEEYYKVVRLETNAVEQEDKDAQYELGMILDDKGHKNQALEYFKQAANQGHKQAADQVMRYEIEEKALQHGDRDAQYQLAVLLERSGHKDRDTIDKIRYLYIEAARQKHPEAAKRVYFMKNVEEKALQGDAKAQFEMALFFDDRGDKALAREFYQKAADQHYHYAELAFAIFLQESKHPDDILKSRKLLQRVALHPSTSRDPCTHYHLGIDYMSNGDVPNAINHFNMAALNHYRDATEKMKEAIQLRPDLACSVSRFCFNELEKLNDKDKREHYIKYAVEILLTAGTKNSKDAINELVKLAENEVEPIVKKEARVALTHLLNEGSPSVRATAKESLEKSKAPNLPPKPDSTPSISATEQKHPEMHQHQRRVNK